MLERDLASIDEALGRDADAWRRLLGPCVREWERLRAGDPGAGRPSTAPPDCSWRGSACPALLPATSLVRLAFREPAARALFTGMAAHSMLPARAAAERLLRARARAAWRMPSAGRWPVGAAARSRPRWRPRRDRWAWRSRPGTGSTRSPTCRRRAPCCSTSRRARCWRSPATGCPPGYRRQLERFRYGPGVFKIDWALDGPIPWRDPATARAGTVHLGGTYREIAASRGGRGSTGRHADQPFVLLVQPTIADPSRAPDGQARRVGVLPRPQRLDGRT